MYFRVLIISFCLWLALSVRGSPRLTCNYNTTFVNDYAFIALPLEVPLYLPKYNDPTSKIPINEKYSIFHYKKLQPVLTWPGMRDRMVHIDYQMIYEQNSPKIVFEEKAKQNEEYYLLESRQFFIMIANPSQILTICINEIFSDLDSIKKAVKKSLPLCINPFTKYPIYFNLYVTSIKNREIIKNSIFFNVTFKFENNYVHNRIWMKEVKFNLHQNHLKLLPFQIRNCENENSVISIKNPEKYDLSFLLIHKFRKYHLNGQPLDDKFIINSQKTLRFMLEAKDSTMTIYTQTVEATDKMYPVLYVPVYCFDKLIIENVPIGIISANNLAFTYPILASSHTNSALSIEEIILTSSTGTVQLNRSQSYKFQLQPLERFVQIASFTIRSSRTPMFRNSLTIKVKYSQLNKQNNSESFQTKKTLTFSELYNPIQINSNRFYDVNQLPKGELDDVGKILHYNYTYTNRLQIPIRMERILFDNQRFRMNWFRYTGFYVYPNRLKEEILLEYIGDRNLPISPMKYAAAMDFSGGIFIPFEVIVYDKTLSCIYHGKETRCSQIKYINFGYHKTEQKVQMQHITIKNLNPINITLKLSNLSQITKTHDITLRSIFSDFFPRLPTSPINITQDGTYVTLPTGHIIILTIEMRVHSSPISGEVEMLIQTEFEKITPKIKFNFEEGRLLFNPQTFIITHFDQAFKGALTFMSTYQQNYKIQQIISDTVALEFFFNESLEYEHNQTVIVPFQYNPYRDIDNITDQCCNQQFLKNHYLYSLVNYQQTVSRNHVITLVTDNDLQKKINIVIDSNKQNLIQSLKKSKIINQKILKVGKNAKFCLQLSNPYPATLKYNTYVIPQQVLYKPKDYVNYFRHAKREKVDAYFCFNPEGRNSNYLTLNTLKQLLHLEDKPQQLTIEVDKMGNINYEQNQKFNLSTNQYVNSVVKTGYEKCYKLYILMYFKLLIQSQILNKIVESYPFEVVEKFIEKQWEHLQDASISLFYEDFYADIKVDFKHHCHTPFFPIFRFCKYYPLILHSNKLQFENQAQKLKKRYRSPAFYLQSLQSDSICMTLVQKQERISFDLVIVNNYSKFADYKVNLHLVQPKILVGNIAFEKNHSINHQTFVKHYFASLSKATNQQLNDAGIENKNKIIPIYLTNQDYQDNFGLFKGQRFFQLQNQADIDIHFTHFGFEDKENINVWSGLQIQQEDKNGSLICLKNKSKSTFKVSFRLDQRYYFNLSNPYFHHKVDLYLYKDQEYHLQLTLLLRVGDNVLPKIKAASEKPEKQQFKFGYIALNFLSFTYICGVILQLKQQEQAEKDKIKTAQQKLLKIIPIVKQKSNSLSDQTLLDNKLKKRSHFLRPQSIGTKINHIEQRRYKPICLISQDDLTFYKTLTYKQDRNSVVSQSSDDHFLIQSHEESVDKVEQNPSLDRSHNQDDIKMNRTNNKMDEQPSEEQFSQSSEEFSEESLPDGISVCNEQLQNMDDLVDFQFGFESQNGKKKQDKKKQDQVGYYNVFSSHNPLKSDKGKGQNPFPWMNQNNDKKKPPRSKKPKEQQQ